MRTPVAVVAVLVASAWAGCLAQDPSINDTVDDVLALLPIPPIPIEADHDHKALDLHAQDANLIGVAYASGFGNGSAAALPQGQGFSELFVRDGLAFLGRRGGDEGGFVIYDVKDPAQPLRLGEYKGLAAYDLESTHDNQYIFFVSQFLNREQPTSIPPDDPGEIPRVIHIIDISNPARPTEVSVFPAPTRGAHTLTYFRTETGRELVTAQLYDFLPDPSLGLPGEVPDLQINPVAQRVVVFDFLRSPEPHLVPLSTFEKHPLGPYPSDIMPHDVSIQKHPITGKLLMYVAYWDLGAYIVDITDPTRPQEIAQMTDFSPSEIRSVHLAVPSDTLIDGIHITVTEPEFSTAGKFGQYTIFDTTNPAQPRRLGSWRLPGDVLNEGSLLFSPHNFEIENGTLYLAHYHGGVWMVDLHNETLLHEPQALAYVQPTAPRPGPGVNMPMIWTALYDHGHVYASDMASGLHVFRYAGNVPKADH